MPENLLTDQAIKKAKPEATPRKLSDGGWLRLEVRPEGGKWWRWRYRFGGKEKMLSLGSLPLADITAPKLLEVLRLVEARGTRVSAHDLRQYAGHSVTKTKRQAPGFSLGSSVQAGTACQPICMQIQFRDGSHEDPQAAHQGQARQRACP